MRTDDLAFSFPSLYAAPGVFPWNAEKLDSWASGERQHKHDPELTPSALHAVRFVLSIEDRDREWGCGRFVLAQAFEEWDEAHLTVFRTWTSRELDERYPGRPWWETASAKLWARLLKLARPPANDPKALDEPQQQRRVVVWWSVAGVLAAVAFALLVQGLMSWKGVWSNQQYPWIPTMSIVLAFALYGWWHLKQAQHVRDIQFQEKEQHFRDREVAQFEKRERALAQAEQRHARELQFAQIVAAAGRGKQDEIALRCAALRQLPGFINDLSFESRGEENPFRVPGIAIILAVAQEAQARLEAEEEPSATSLLKLLAQHARVSFESVRHQFDEEELEQWGNVELLLEREPVSTTSTRA